MFKSFFKKKYNEIGEKKDNEIGETPFSATISRHNSSGNFAKKVTLSRNMSAPYLYKQEQREITAEDIKLLLEEIAAIKAELGSLKDSIISTMKPFLQTTLTTTDEIEFALNPSSFTRSALISKENNLPLEYQEELLDIWKIVNYKFSKLSEIYSTIEGLNILDLNSRSGKIDKEQLVRLFFKEPGTAIKASQRLQENKSDKETRKKDIKEHVDAATYLIGTTKVLLEKQTSKLNDIQTKVNKLSPKVMKL